MTMVTLINLGNGAYKACADDEDGGRHSAISISGVDVAISELFKVLAENKKKKLKSMADSFLSDYVRVKIDTPYFKKGEVVDRFDLEIDRLNYPDMFESLKSDNNNVNVMYEYTTIN